LALGITELDVCGMAGELYGFKGGDKKREGTVRYVPGSPLSKKLESLQGGDGVCVMAHRGRMFGGKKISEVITAFEVGPTVESSGAALRVAGSPEKVPCRRMKIPDDVKEEVGSRSPRVRRRVKCVVTGAFAIRVDGKSGVWMRAAHRTTDLARQRKS
jgi:hypothetical protein